MDQKSFDLNIFLLMRRMEEDIGFDCCHDGI